MDTYEVVLISAMCASTCPFYRAELVLGTLPAASRFEAKDKAVEKWPDARESEMIVRSAKPIVVKAS